MAKLIGVDGKKPHIAVVAVTVKEPRLVDGVWVEVDNTVEVPARKEKWDSLSTATKREAYARECAEFHSANGPDWEAKRAARRAAWDADDKAREEAKFIMRHVSTDENGVRVSVTWKGYTFEHVIPNDPATATANAQAAHDLKISEEQAKVQMFNRVLTADELQLMEGMLAWKYGQQTLLPAAHTHSADAPAVINVPVPVSTVSTATTTADGLMSAPDKVKLNGVATGAEVNVQSDWNQAVTTVDDFIKNKPTLGTASSKNVAAIGNAATGEVVQGSDTRLADARTPTTHTHAQSDVTNLTTDLTAKEVATNKVTAISAASTNTQYPSAKLAYDQLLLKEATANKGVASGYAGLGADGRVPFAQLPTSVGIGFRLWTPADMGTARAIDIDFEAEALGALASINNNGSLGGTATAAAGEEPTVDAVDATGRRGALFDGVNDNLRSSAIWSLGTTYGMFAVYRRAASGAGMLISTEYPTNVAYTLGQVQTAANNGVGGDMVHVGHFNGAWRNTAANSVLANALGIVVGNFDGTNLNARIFGTDNLAAQTSLSGVPSGNTRIGRRWDTAGNSFFAGRIFRVVCKSGAFTTGEMQLLEGWAAHRWNTAASLPAAHPFRNSPPIVAL